MKKLLALFISLAFLTGTASVSMADTTNTGKSKTANSRTHNKKRSKTTKKTNVHAKTNKKALQS